ncbi:hypothetical protein B0187_08870 [Haemophilus paracuniculus]|uniref:Lipoprotein n=1 Tax=Haemophilus paracuniculus TaxID=734 RepID=A0A1T0AQM1_9PAST|nr:hypothetical protein [Haemophilus paracuniculus]OOR98371.1 hypothetical protein B0187_08870 [Haemophilus paracuniculus]
MKKRLLAGGFCLALLGCSSTSKVAVSQSELVGNWTCTTEYKDLGFTTIDKYQFHDNGTMKTSETINYIANFQPLFSYKTQGQGKWQLKNNRLIFRLTKSGLRRESIRSNDLRLEERVSTMLRELDGQSATVTFALTQFSPNRFEFKQLVKEGNGYAGRCVRGK